jgi:hypothetical protein
MAYFIFRSILELSLDQKTSGDISEIMIGYNMEEVERVKIPYVWAHGYQHVLQRVDQLYTTANEITQTHRCVYGLKYSFSDIDYGFETISNSKIQRVDHLHIIEFLYYRFPGGDFNDLRFDREKKWSPIVLNRIRDIIKRWYDHDEKRIYQGYFCPCQKGKGKPIDKSQEKRHFRTEHHKDWVFRTIYNCSRQMASYSMPNF